MSTRERAAPPKRAIRVSPEADRVMIAGSTGDGKTTLAKHIIRGLQPCKTLICDSKDCFQGYGVTVRTAGQLERALRDNRIPRVRWVPISFKRDYLEECWEIIRYAPGPLIVLVDEASEMCTSNWIPTGYRLSITQGRKPGQTGKDRKLMFSLTQRIAETHPVIRTQADHLLVMNPPPAEIDCKTIAGAIRRKSFEVEDELRSLFEECGPYSHLWYVKEENALRRMAPLRL